MPQDIALGMNPDKFAKYENANRLAVDFSHVLIVGRSQINKVVVGRIVQRSGLKPLAEMPESAPTALRRSVPGVIVLDGGPENRDCDLLIENIVALRRASGKNLPRIILLSNKTVDPRNLSNAIDAVVTKPITTERLQPVLELLIRSIRS